MYRQPETIWASDVGADAWSEANDGRHIFWTPKRNNPQGTGYHGTVVSAQNNTVDTFRGGPGMRGEHIHEIVVDGFDELWIQWSGECVSSSGFGIDAGSAGINYPRTMWADRVWGWANGVAHWEDGLPYTQTPPAVTYNAAQAGTNAAPMTNDFVPGESMIWAGGCKLHVQFTGYSFPGFGNPSNYFARGAPVTLPFDEISDAVGDGFGSGALFYGYTQTNGAGASISRLPQVEDRYGFLAKIGWSSANYENTAGMSLSPNAPPYYGDLRVTGLDKIFCCFFSAAALGGSPNWVTFNNGPGNSHVVKGRLYAIKVRYQD